MNGGAASCNNTGGVQRKAPRGKKLNKSSEEVMRVMALCSRTPDENWHFYKYPHLKNEENCPRIPLETLWDTSNPGKLHTQKAHPKEEGGQPTLPKSNCCWAQALPAWMLA